MESAILSAAAAIESAACSRVRFRAARKQDSTLMNPLIKAHTAIDGAEDAIVRLNCSGRRVILVTNQSGVARGLCTEAELQSLHTQLQQH